MNRHIGIAGIARLLLALSLLSLSAMVGASVDQDRAKVRKQSQEVLARLYQAQPSARAAIANANGYATFSRWGVKLGAVGGGIGRGLAVETRSGQEPFMRFVEGSAGLGLGIKKYALIFVFETEQSRADFINKGWEGGAQATAAVKSSRTGNAYAGAASVSPGVWVYQITEKGPCRRDRVDRDQVLPGQSAELNCGDVRRGFGTDSHGKELAEARGSRLNPRRPDPRAGRSAARHQVRVQASRRPGPARCHPLGHQPDPEIGPLSLRAGDLVLR